MPRKPRREGPRPKETHGLDTWRDAAGPQEPLFQDVSSPALLHRLRPQNGALRSNGDLTLVGLFSDWLLSVIRTPGNT